MVSLKDHIRNLLIKSKFEEALKVLTKPDILLQLDEEEANSVVLFSGRFQRLKSEKGANHISKEEYDIGITRLSSALLGFVSEIQEEIMIEGIDAGLEHNITRRKSKSLKLVGVGILMLVLLSSIGYYFMTRETPVPLIDFPTKGEYAVGQEMNIDFQIPEYEGKVDIEFVESGSNKKHRILSNMAYPQSGVTWTPQQDLAGKSGYISISLADRTTGRGELISFFEKESPVVQVDEEGIDIGIEGFAGKIYWINNSGSLSNRRWGLTIKGSVTNYSNKVVSCYISFETMKVYKVFGRQEPITYGWQELFHKNAVEIRPGGSELIRDTLEQNLGQFFGFDKEGGLDHLFRIKVGNALDKNPENNIDSLILYLPWGTA